MRYEVDIVEFNEKYYLFGMKFEADPRRRPFFFIGISAILGQKVQHYLATISSDHFFLQITAFLRLKVHLGAISSDGFF